MLKDGKYQKTTSYHNGAIRVTVDQEMTIITKLAIIPSKRWS